MATGIGLMFRIDIPMNFNSPYRALTILDFWKRWHITLTRFFTRYVYIPLGGNRKGKLRTYLNIFLVFFVSGIWHGANWTFIFWGILHGVANVITRIFENRIKKLHPAFLWLVTFCFINLTWIYFRADSISQGTYLINTIISCDFGTISKEIVSCFALPEINYVLNFFGKTASLFVMVVYYLFALFAVLVMKNTNERIDSFKPSIAMSLLTPILIVWSILSFSGVSSFLYFNF